jgi:Copper type II ascorbate-dependent monooxygenase, C-terminal domain
MRASFLLLAALLISCGGKPAETGITYSTEVAPLLNEKCVKCHQAGGIAPFALDTFSAAEKMAGTIAAVVQMGMMPPYLVTHDGSCGEFEDGETLTAAQIDLLQRWAVGPRVEGQKVALTPPVKPGIDDGRAVSTPNLVPMAAGTKLAEADEYRCFPVDAKLAKDSFITAYDVSPGNPAIVHHVVAFVVDPNKKTASGKTNAEAMKMLDDSDPDRVGWPCYSLAGQGVEVDSVPAIWAPGQGPVVYPYGLGVRQRATDQLVVQIHYNLFDETKRGQSDSTTVRLRYADTVARRAIFVLKDAFIETVARGMADSLPPGLAVAPYSWKSSGAQLGVPAGPGLELVGVMPHMHTRGLRKQMTLTGPDGVSRCAAKVDRWDFNWQKFYFYKGTLPRIMNDTQLQLTCEYTTLADRMAVMPGWGTQNEMCIAILMLALPPGA